MYYKAIALSTMSCSPSKAKLDKGIMMDFNKHNIQSTITWNVPNLING